MAITLLHLPSGHYSLEFDLSDLPSVATAIRKRYGVPEKRLLPTITEYSFGECSFVFQNEWAEPCLIADTTKGDEILQALHADLTTID